LQDLLRPSYNKIIKTGAFSIYMYNKHADVYITDTGLLNDISINELNNCLNNAQKVTIYKDKK